MPLTNHGKIALAHAMFFKGKSFLAAGILLDRDNGHKDVVLYLICQGLEILQKSLLMLRDCNKYGEEKLKKIGHDLMKGSDELINLYQFRPLKTSVREELKAVNAYYSDEKRKDPLRYFGIHDIFGGHSLTINLVVRRSLALIRLGERFFIKARFA